MKKLDDFQKSLEAEKKYATCQVTISVINNAQRLAEEHISKLELEGEEAELSMLTYMVAYMRGRSDQMLDGIECDSTKDLFVGKPGH